jgi:N-acyl-D-amino-acid deacylase
MKKKIEILIRGGTVYEGGLSAPSVEDVGITGDLIVSKGRIHPDDAVLIIDAEGLAVAPGFIDTHAHSDFTILADPRAEGKISQGITTEINGNCGMSAAPLYGKAFEKRQDDLRELRINERWSSLGEYFELVEQRGVSLNVATLAGHGNIRGSIVGYEDRVPVESEFADMSGLLMNAIEEGAIGLSTGLIYPPGVYAQTEELVRLAKCLRKDDLIYASHIRSEGDMLAESVMEVIRIGREAGIRVHISHLKTSGEKNWFKAEEVISLIKAARSSGVALTCDRYPYIAANTDLDAILPAWAYEGGNEEEIKRLMNPYDRERIRQELEKQAGGKDYWTKVIVSAVDSQENAWMEGRTISEISASIGINETETLFRILKEERLRVGAIFLSMNEENLKKFLSLPFCMIGSDSSGRSFDGPTNKGKPHPRGFGTFPRFISRYAGDKGIMGLSEAIYRSTTLAAETFSVKGRGALREGMYADIVVFDPAEIRDVATFENPWQRSAGIEYVFVNGIPVISRGHFTGKFPGRVLRRGR